MRYLLSKLIPMKFTSTYGVYDNPSWEGTPPSYSMPDRNETAQWWQWRDRIFRYQVV